MGQAKAGGALVHAFCLKSTIRSDQALASGTCLAKRIRLITARIIEKG